MPIKILMPALSPTMTEGNLVKWHKQEGDAVKIGDILAEIETDKATMEVEAIDEGILGKIYVAAGSEEVKVNTLIAALLEEGEDPASLSGLAEAADSSAATKAEQPEPSKAAPLPQSPNSAPQSSTAPAVSSAAGSSATAFATPVARRIAQQNDLNLAGLSGTGPYGRIIKADVEAALVSGTIALQPSRSPQVAQVAASDLYPAYEEIKLNSMRKVIAKRLSESKQTVPHFYLTIECNLDNVLAARTQMNATLEKERRISVNDFVIKALACGMRAVPEANAAWGEDHVKLYHAVDVSVAVAIEGGLVTPIIRNAAQKTLSQISAEMKELAARARAGKLRPEEFQGGTVSISNLGMFGIKEFGAVINPPQACILAVGAGEKRVIVTEAGDFKAATVMSCTLSVDHRVVDGAVGANFLKAFKTFIENPVTMLL
jgi:pyruvate dehydrogenase E2 component (dihydrolipoamide acetyltransferase)